LKHKPIALALKEGVLYGLRLSPATHPAGYCSLSALSRFTGIPQKRLKKILRELERERTVESYRSMGFTFYREKNLMYG